MAPTPHRLRAPARAAWWLALSMALSTAAQAQTWIGTGASDLWSDRFNWQGGVAPRSGPATALTFAGALRTNPVQNIASVFSLNSMTFAAGSAGFTLTGNALGFSSDARFVQNAASPVIIGNEVQVFNLLTYQGDGSTTFAGPLTVAPTSVVPPTLFKLGTGSLTLSAANPFTGRVQVEQGWVVAKDARALQFADVLIGAAGGLDLSQQAQASVGGLSGRGALALGPTQLTVGGSGRSPGVYSGNLSATTGSLRKIGTGTLQLSGLSTIDAVRVMEGELVFEGGEMTLTNPVQGLELVPELLSVGAPVMTVRGGAAVTSVGRVSQIDGGAGTLLRVQGAGSRLAAGSDLVVGSGAQGRLEVSDGGVAQSSLYAVVGLGGGSSGAIDVSSGGRLASQVGGIGVHAGAVGDVTVRGNGSTWQTTVIALGGLAANARGGTGKLTISGGGAVTVLETVGFWSDNASVVIDGGRLVAGGLTSQAGPGSILLERDPSGASALHLTGTPDPARFTGSLSGSGSVTKSGSGTQVLAGSNRFTGAVQVLGGTLDIDNSTASDYAVSSGAVLRLGEGQLGAAVVRASAGGTVSYTAATLSGGRLLGSGTHDISTVQRLVGTDLAAGARLVPASGARFVGVDSGGTVVIQAGSSLSWAGGSAAGGLSVAGQLELVGFRSTGVLELLPAGALFNRDSDLMLGGGSRTTIGSASAPGGTLRLLDGTRVQLDGALLVNNGTLDGPLFVNFGSLAKGAGSFGSVTVTDGGRFSPGNSPGTARTASATWGAGGSYLVELAAASGTAGIDWDLWLVDGTLDITAGPSDNSRFSLSVVTLGAAGQSAPLAGFDPQRSWRWRIADARDGIRGFDLSVLTLDVSGFAGDTAGGSFSLAMAGDGLDLVFAPVPEPGSAALLLAGVAGLLAWRSRSRPPVTAGA